MFNDEQNIAIRSANNPLITTESADIGNNINGPSVIKVPDWITDRYGNYYMYFAHHGGLYVRLAYADSPEGPWTVSSDKILPVSSIEDLGYSRHIASPDVHVDAENKRIVLYYHAPHDWPEQKARGRLITEFDQLTGVAYSFDGLNFTNGGDVPLTFSYLRLFSWNDTYYGLSARALVFRYDDKVMPDGSKTMIERELPLGSWRHCSICLEGDRLYVFYTRWGDKPERVVVSYIDLSEDWNDWKLSPAVTVLKSKGSLEGEDLPLLASKTGAAHTPLHELRDPCFFRVDNHDYLYYSYAGEQGIAVASLVEGWQQLVVKAIENNKIDLPDKK